ncbi:ankyrin repeat-containing protein ITN1 [Lactuca sativa]|uniref:ankyrin repeat-containing protein ITN1 n=1 Tax=Lactuca sativa TaxID=4236 RepID=UPI000CD89E04|nr:ankyrin repeat-containing protein ITN1 [Lactuca sativa]
MANSRSSSNPHVTLEVREENPYTYPSHVCAPHFVTFKLSDRDEYGVWKTQMLCLLESHSVSGFIDGTLVSPDEASSSSSVSGKEKVVDHQTHQKLWRRSDSLVKGWILGSLSKETLVYIVNRLTGKLHQDDFSAKDVWDELQTMYAPAVVPKLHVVEDTLQDQDRVLALQRLYHSTRHGIWHWVEEILWDGRVTVIDKITNNGNTALHVAVGTSKKLEFLEKLLEKIPENTQLMDLRNSDGSTPLHVAAIIGNTEAVGILVARNPELLLAKDKKDLTPLALALSNMHTDTARHLLQHINNTDDTQKDALFSGTTGDGLLVTVISSKDFHFARKLLKHYKTLHSDAVLMSIAENFPSKVKDFERYTGTEELLERADGFPPWVLILIILPFICVTGFIIWLFMKVLNMFVPPFIKERVRTHDDAMRLLEEVCELIRRTNHSSCYHNYYTTPILEATRLNAYEVVEEIVTWFPNAIWCANEDGHNFILYAAINRSEKVYNLLYQMSEHKNIYRTLEDSSRNNLLHLAARLAPSNKLNLISGAALQIQHELQWFKEVEKFICPLSIKQKNSLNETPQMVFTREHMELVIEGEKWMKSTAESYTITAALIITIVFAAAITVPGGSNQDTGIPTFTNNTAFIIFAISDAISLFAAVTSLLMFLSILTACFAEQDFLFKLPTKLIIGLATLFVSTTAMIVAFGATLYLVFGQRNWRILIPIAVLTCLPITSFVTLQFPLVLDLMSATYGRSIFGLGGRRIII